MHARERATRQSPKGVRALGRDPAEREDDLFNSLQRSVGNRAVTLLMQRAPKDRPTSTDAPGRRPPPKKKEAPPKKAAADIRARVIRYEIVKGEGLITIASGTDQGVKVGMTGSLVKSGGTEYALFLRQFGCSCLAERWDLLREEIPGFIAGGAQVVAVGQGEPERSAAVARRRGYHFAVLSDPERRAYTAYGLLQGTPAQLVHDFPWRPGDMESAEGIFLRPRRGTERAVVDDPWQLPGEFVIDRAGTIVLAHRYQYCEDFPPKTVLLGAIAAARARVPESKEVTR